MSRHEVVIENMRYVFGWDQPLQSFFLQVHNTALDEESNPTHWYGTHPNQPMYEVEDLVRAASKHALILDREMLTTLCADKDEGR